MKRMMIAALCLLLCGCQSVQEDTPRVSQTEDAPAQLTDWGETSSRQAIALTEYLLNAYTIDASRVFAEGYSGGARRCRA